MLSLSIGMQHAYYTDIITIFVTVIASLPFLITVHRQDHKLSMDVQVIYMTLFKSRSYSLWTFLRVVQ